MSRNTLLTALLVLPLAFLGCASDNISPVDDDSAISGSGGASASGGTDQQTGGAGPQSGGASSGGASASGGADPIGSGGESTSGGASASGGSETGGSDTGGTSTGGSDGEATFNPCPTNGDPCKILPFGDSITFGVGSSDEGGYRSRLFGLALAASQKITFVGSQNTGPTQVSGKQFPRSHEGHSGWTIDPGFSTWAGGISARVPNPAFNTVPHIVLLMIGTNDVNATQGQSTMTNRLENLLDKIVQAAPDALIVLAQITPLGWNPQALTNYNAAIPALVESHAAEGQHVIRVDMSQMPRSGLDGDNIHPNNQGYEFMAKVWHDAIKEFLPAESTPN